MNTKVNVTRAEGIAHVQLNRPDRHNALDWDMFLALDEAASALQSDRSLRVVVISGAGPSFCSGLDYPAMQAHPDAFRLGFAREAGVEANLFQRAGWAWKRLPVPVIAAVHGACFGGGIQIALGADIRLAHPEARLSVMEIKWGLIPDMSASLTLRELVRADVAKELVYTGKIVSGTDAAELGLVTRLAADPLAEAMALAHQIAEKNPDAIRRGKRLFDANWAEPDAEQALLREQEEQTPLLGSPNQLEAARAALSKTPARFADPSC